MPSNNKNNNSSNANKNWTKGGKNSDLIIGTDSADQIDGKQGDDNIHSGAGDDWIKGGTDNDVINGGAGNDRVDGGAGDDTAVYSVGENAGASDAYDGGSGIDAVLLEMSFDEWMRDDIQADVAAYLQFIIDHTDPDTGEVDGEIFHFASLNLDVRKFESLRVSVDGVELDPRDELVVANSDAQTTLTEHSTVSGNVLDNDDVPDLVRAVELLDGPAKGQLSFNADGSYSYDPGNEFNALAEGESEKVFFSYRVSDADHDFADALVTITVTGTNDTPIANVDVASTDENASVTIDVLANDTDVDTNDIHTVDAVSVADGQGSVSIVNNQVEWVPGTDFDYLALGETASVEIAYDMSDNHGGLASSTITLTVIGSNDGPIANIDNGTTGENTAITVDVLSNDTDLDENDTHTVKTVSITQGLGTALIVDNNVEWSPGTDYDYLALGESADVELAYTMSDNNGAESNSTVNITVVGSNDAPTVAAALVSDTDEDADDYQINLLDGASDVDNGFILNAGTVTETDGKGGWSIDGNTLTVNPNFYDSMNDGDFETLNLNYQVIDEHGATVDQSLTVNIEGITDAPSLSVETSASGAVNEVQLSITSQPARTERVELRFNSLALGAIVLNSDGVDVTAGINDYIGTEIFTLVLPEGTSVDDDMVVSVTGVKDSGEVIGESVQTIDVAYQVSSSVDLVNFSTEDQNMWGTGDAAGLGWHEYIPFIGTETEAWGSGEFSLIDVGVDFDDLANSALSGFQSVLDLANGALDEANAEVTSAKAAEVVAESKANHVDGVVAAWAVYSLKHALYITAKAAYDTAESLASGASSISDGAEQELATAESHLSTLQSQRSSLYSDSQYTYSVWIPTPEWLDPFKGHWESRTGTDPIKYALVVAKDAEILLQKGVIATLKTAISLADVGADALQDAADALKPAYDSTKADSDSAYATASNLETAMHNAGFYVNESVDVLDVTAAWAAHVAAEALIIATEVVVVAAEGAVALAQGAYDVTETAIDTIDFDAEIKIDAEVDAKVGLQIDFDLDLGSVDADIDYQLTTGSQYNLTTDLLQITPTMNNLTTGESVAFSTISPNVTFHAGILYNLGAAIDIFIDGKAIIDGTSIFDLSPDSDGLAVNEAIRLEGEIVLVDFDSTDVGPFQVPFIESLTEDVVSIEINIPTIETEGTATDFDIAYFQEGGLLNLDFSEITGAFFNLIEAGIDFSPEIKAYFTDVGNIDEGSEGFDAVMAAAGQVLKAIWETLNGDADTDGDGVVPIFIIDATDETSTSLLHLNLVPDDLSGIDVDTGSFGFYASYGESEPLVKITIDIDQFIALVANVAVGNASGVVLNPLDIEIGLDYILKEVKVPENIRTEIKKFVSLNAVIERADLDVNSSWNFSQEFTLSVDDMSFQIIMEDGAEYMFAANSADNLLINNASQHDANNDGSIDYSITLVPDAMFSNDTELGLSLGYTLDFIKAQFDAGVSLPLGDLLGIPAIPSLDFTLLDLDFGPLLRLQADLDVLDIDLFEDRFAIDLGSDQVSGGINAFDDTLIGTDGNDDLYAYEGRDVLIGGLGDDFLSGGAGNDLFVFAQGDGQDTISDFDMTAGDLIDLQLLSSVDSFTDVQEVASNDSNGNTILDFGEGDSITLLGVEFNELNQDNFIV